MKVLLIDDEQAILDVFSAVLTQGGHQVTTASNARDGIAKAQSELPNVIFVDQILPDLNGNNVVKTLKGSDLTKNIPVAILSNYSQDTMMQEAIQSGAADYILKYQIEPQDLLQKIIQLSQSTPKETDTIVIK